MDSIKDPISERNRKQNGLKYSLEIPEEFIKAYLNLKKCRMIEYNKKMSYSMKEAEFSAFPVHHQDSIKMVRELIVTRPDVGFLRTDDEFILRFLHARKFDVRESFQLYASYFIYRQKNKNLFCNFNACEPGIKSALLDGFPGVLPDKDCHGHQILIFYASNWDHTRYSLISIYRALLLSLEKLIENEETQRNGFLIIIDWSGFTFRQSCNMNPKTLKLIIDGLQDCFPGRFSGIHFINQPWYVEVALTIIKPFLKDKTKKKLFMHGNNLTTLYTHIEKDILPAELGGSGPPYNIEQWAKQVIDDKFVINSSTDIFLPVDGKIEIDSTSKKRYTSRSKTYPCNSYNLENPGIPSVTELDEDFFLT